MAKAARHRTTNTYKKALTHTLKKYEFVEKNFTIKDLIKKKYKNGLLVFWQNFNVEKIVFHTILVVKMQNMRSVSR